MERTLYTNNKIVESLCQFTFKPVQDNTIYGQFWDVLKKENIYSEKENISALNFSLVANDPDIKPSLVNAMKYSNSNKDKIIQLHNNNFSIHQVKKYDKWESFKKDIDSAFNNFISVSTETVIDRIDLRAINVFDFPLEDFKLDEYFNLSVNYPIGLNNVNSNVTLEFSLGKENCFVVLRLKCSKQSTKINVVLDLSFVNIEANIKSSDKDAVDTVLEYGHIELYNMFSSVIKDKRIVELIK